MSIRKRLIGITLCAVLLFTQLTAFSGIAASASNKSWAGTWSTSPVRLGYTVGNSILCDFLASCSVRTVIKTSSEGEKVRLRFSNRYGKSNLEIEAVRIARTGTRSETEIIEGTSLPVTFGKSESVSVAPGKTIYSDPVNMHVEALEELSISVYYKSYNSITTGGLINSISYVDPGNKIDAKTFTANAPLTIVSGTITYHTTPFLCGVDTYGANNSCIAFFGDSTLANDAPMYLAEKLNRAGIKTTGVLQEAIIGNRLLYDSTGATSISNLYGEAGLTRFKEDILDQSGITTVFVKMGLNDVLHPRSKSLGPKVLHCSAEDIIDGYRMLISMAHEKGIKIYFYSRQAWKGYQRDFFGSDGTDLEWTQEADDVLATLNKWLKYSSGSNGYINTDPLRDPQDSRKIYPPYTTDGAHMTPLGAQVLVDLIPNIYLTNTKLSSIREYYENGGKDIRNYTPKSKYTKPAPVTKAPTGSSGASHGSVQATGGAVLPTYAPNKAPSTTSIAITSPSGDTVTEVFLVEITDPVPAATVPTPETMAYQVPPAERAELSGTAKAGIIIFVILTVALITFGVIYGVNKKMSAD